MDSFALVYFGIWLLSASLAYEAGGVKGYWKGRKAAGNKCVCRTVQKQGSESKMNARECLKCQHEVRIWAKSQTTIQVLSQQVVELESFNESLQDQLRVSNDLIEEQDVIIQQLKAGDLLV